MALIRPTGAPASWPIAAATHPTLTVATLAEHTHPPAGMIPLIRNEITRLLAALACGPGNDTRYWLRWSAWRRRHQPTPLACHYRRRAASDP